MYTIPVKIAPSLIEGKGVFTQQDITKGTVVWIFKKGYDLTMTVDEYDSSSRTQKTILDKTGYLSPWTNQWIYPPARDPAQYTNHSNQNNLSVVYEKNTSEEPYFIANRDILSGEELTNNYHEFDRITQITNQDWAK